MTTTRSQIDKARRTVHEQRFNALFEKCQRDVNALTDNELIFLARELPERIRWSDVPTSELQMLLEDCQVST